MSSEGLTFDALVTAIRRAHDALAADAARAVNRSLTLRNWAIGAYLVEFEQRGADRAAYGARLFDSLAERLRRDGMERAAARSLRTCRQFYLTYPEIWPTVSAKSLPAGFAREIVGTLSAQLETSQTHQVREKVSATSAAVPPLGPELLARLVEQLTFSHFVELLAVEDPLARRFYEAATLRGNWSVRELRRQITTLYFERTGLSTDKAAAMAEVRSAAAGRPGPGPGAFVRDPYVFEFLGLDPKHVMREGPLEDALLDRLQAFLLELGYGFCFEARQKRLVIGEKYYFVDLVFYHRVLKCHVLVELKAGDFTHEHLGQLNTYVSYYRATQMTEGDQPPVGILLCAGKERALVGMNNALFVSRYQVGLPDQEQITAFVRRAVEGVGGENA